VWRLTAAEVDSDRVPLSRVRFAVVDVETTGSSVSRGARVVEFSAVLVQGGGVTDEFTTLVNPDAWIPRWVTCLEGRVFVAHNVAFDWRFVSEELRLARSVVPEGPRLCTVKLARRALPGLRRRGLDSLARYYDVVIENRHRAGDDARATAVLLLRMLEVADRQGIRYWDQLENWIAGRPADPALPPLGTGTMHV
jgi:DNA polymerase-3 subunit epsilon